MSEFPRRKVKSTVPVVPPPVDSPKLASTASLGIVKAYGLRQIGSEWPGIVWSHKAESLLLRPGWELVEITIKPV